MISIVTGWGRKLGTGHVQRMAALAEFLFRNKNTECRIVGDRAPDFLPASIHHYFHSGNDTAGGWIIHDRRDSTVNDMASLRRRGRVITIDDCGEGRTSADASIDLLPNLKFNQQEKTSFIYGYNFIQSLRAAGKTGIHKNIDVAVYAGYDPAPETLRKLRSFIPERSTCAILSGKDPVLLENNTEKRLMRPYAEILAASRVLMTHFGITLYEGSIAGCRLVTVNPTEYHSQLADKVRDDLGVINIGILDGADHGRAFEIISHGMNNPLAEIVYPEIMLEKTTVGLENLYSLLMIKMAR